MKPGDLQQRAKDFALKIIKTTEAKPRDRASAIISRQIIRSATTGADNYRGACRARSKSEFIATLGIVEEEADETLFWLEILVAADKVNIQAEKACCSEDSEILAMTVASLKTAKTAQPSKCANSAIRNPKSSLERSHEHP